MVQTDPTRHLLYKQAGHMQGRYEQQAAAVQRTASNTKHRTQFVYVTCAEIQLLMVLPRGGLGRVLSSKRLALVKLCCLSLLVGLGLVIRESAKAKKQGA